MRIIRVFISSREHELAEERFAVDGALRSLFDIEGFLAERDLSPARQQADSYLEELEKCNLVALLLDRTLGPKKGKFPPVERELSRAFAKGIPYLVFVKERSDAERDKPVIELLRMMRIRGVKVASFADSVDLQNKVKTSVIHAIYSRFLSGPEIVDSVKGMYLAATEVIRSARERVYFAQRTPILLFGPTGEPWQIGLFESVCGWLRKVMKHPTKHRFIMLYPQQDVFAETELGTKLVHKYPYFLGMDLKRSCRLERKRVTSPDDVPRTLQERIQLLRDLEEQTGGAFKFRGLTSIISPLLIVDSGVALYVFLIGQKGIVYKQTDASIANALVDEIDEGLIIAQ